jgi:hypothetical protein
MARCLTFQILKEGRKEGFFALMVVRQQARIAGIWLENPSVANWRIAFHLAQDIALRQTDACEITARGISDMSAAAAAEAGMRLRSRLPALFYRKGGGSHNLPFEFQLADDDGCFHLHRPPGFLT